MRNGRTFMRLLGVAALLAILAPLLHVGGYIWLMAVLSPHVWANVVAWSLIALPALALVGWIGVRLKRLNTRGKRGLEGVVVPEGAKPLARDARAILIRVLVWVPLGALTLFILVSFFQTVFYAWTMFALVPQRDTQMIAWSVAALALAAFLAWVVWRTLRLKVRGRQHTRKDS